MKTIKRLISNIFRSGKLKKINPDMHCIYFTDGEKYYFHEFTSQTLASREDNPLFI